MYDTMPTLKDALAGITAGDLLDVAVGHGTFLGMFLNTVKSCTSVTAVDIEDELLQDAERSLADFQIRFVKADASNLPFSDFSFDTVTMANALHHVTPIPSVLKEIRRVCKGDGRFILHEMLSDGLDDAEMTHHLMHHLRIDIDMERGVPHRPVISGSEVSSLLAENGFKIIEESVHKEEKPDPAASESISQYTQTIDGILKAAEDSPKFSEYRKRAESIKERLFRVGVKRPRSILVIAR